MPEGTTPQKPQMVYNNPRFTVKEYDWDVFGGPAAGEQFIDATLTDVATGEAVKLSDYAGKWLVIETGSSTCSMYTKNIDDMRALGDDFPDVEFVLIYVREAHPGERRGPHQSQDDKMKAAAVVKPRYQEHRRVLVDSVEGDFHKAYGFMPNILYIVRPDGTIHYRCNWATAEGIRGALEDRENLHTYENADVAKLKAQRGIGTAIRTMYWGGFLALYDFVRAGPGMAIRHKKVDAFYRKNGKFNQKPGLFSTAADVTADDAAKPGETEASQQPGE